MTRFARETGDIYALSAVDVKLLALAHTLEVLVHGAEHLRAHPEALPDGPGELADRVTDFLAGMTDRYALAYAAKL